MKILDVHCHYPGVNPAFNSVEDLHVNKIKKSELKIGIRYYCHNLGIKYTTNFSEFNKNSEKKLIETVNDSIADQVVILAFDGVYRKGKIVNHKSILYVDNEKAYALAKKQDKMLFGASINPEREDALEELEKISKLNPALIKMHPAFQLFDPKNEKYKKLYKAITKLKIPVLMHTGQEYSIPGAEVDKKVQSIENTIPLLELGCTVIAAHGGGAFLLKDKKTFKKVIKLLEQYPNLYLDISAIANIHSKQRLIRVLKNELAVSRSIYGSDYPLAPTPVVLLPELGIKKYSELRKTKNLISKDIMLKKKIGYPPEVFERGYKIIKN